MIKETHKMVAKACEDISGIFNDKKRDETALIWIERSITLRQNYNFPIALSTHNGYLNLLQQLHITTNDRKYINNIAVHLEKYWLDLNKVTLLNALEFLSYYLALPKGNFAKLEDKIKKSLDKMLSRIKQDPTY